MGSLVLVTGASGFVGSHVVDAFLAEGWGVRALVRGASSLAWLPRETVEVVHGDMTDPASLAAALRGVELVVHAAGILAASREDDYARVNVAGTQDLARAAAAQGLRRFVLVSSLSAGGPSLPGRPRRETDPDSPISGYGRSKLHGEEALLRSAGSMPWTIVRPAAVYGPRDRGFLTLARVVRRGWIPKISGPTQELQLLHARDLARGIVLAATSPAGAGRRYYLAHPAITNSVALCALMASALGCRPRWLFVPRRTLPAISRVVGDVAVMRRKPHPLSPDRLKDYLAPAWTCDVSRAQSELGYTPKMDLREGISETMAWYRSAGWL